MDKSSSTEWLDQFDLDLIHDVLQYIEESYNANDISKRETLKDKILQRIFGVGAKKVMAAKL